MSFTIPSASILPSSNLSTSLTDHATGKIGKYEVAKEDLPTKKQGTIKSIWSFIFPKKITNEPKLKKIETAIHLLSDTPITKKISLLQKSGEFKKSCENLSFEKKDTTADSEIESRIQKIKQNRAEIINKHRVLLCNKKTGHNIQKMQLFISHDQGLTITDVLNDPIMKNYIKAQSKREFSEENIEAWDQVQQMIVSNKAWEIKDICRNLKQKMNEGKINFGYEKRDELFLILDNIINTKHLTEFPQDFTKGISEISYVILDNLVNTWTRSKDTVRLQMNKALDSIELKDILRSAKKELQQNDEALAKFYQTHSLLSPKTK